jgi:hypothetical protein
MQFCRCRDSNQWKLLYNKTLNSNGKLKEMKQAPFKSYVVQVST